jgi:hypothetical protein
MILVSYLRNKYITSHAVALKPSSDKVYQMLIDGKEGKNCSILLDAMVHACHSSYSGAGDSEGHGPRLAASKSIRP